jgi:hypothetical protein
MAYKTTVSDRDMKQPPATEEGVRSAGSMETYIDPKAEARVMRKFDVRSTPTPPVEPSLGGLTYPAQMYAVSLLGLFYLMAILDRNNLGNANIAGMSEELGLVGNQFGTAVTLL